MVHEEESIENITLYADNYSIMSQKVAVLQFLQTLPKNKVTTYKALATKFDTHPRAIATYMRTNKEYNLYPCYKVVAADG
jgi:O6-methylguanine-DNA--protein-cysteine methyltransferase